MKAAPISGTENYEAQELLKPYDSISFADAHAPALHLIPAAPCRALDIGAGPDATRPDLLPSGTRSSPSNRPKNFAVARFSCIRRRRSNGSMIACRTWRLCGRGASRPLPFVPAKVP
jgi:hypothetical protein